MSTYISPELVKQAQKVDLLTYLQNYEPQELVRYSNDTFVTKTHDSLKISNGLWNWFSAGVGGNNAIDYLTKVKGYSFKEAVEIILKNEKLYIPLPIKKQTENCHNALILPEKNINNNRAIAYLKSRGINDTVIKKFLDKKMIYEEKTYHNIVFVGYDERGIAQYAGCRATNESNLKNDATGSNKAYSFRWESNEKTDKLFIFEGAIDLLSYATFFYLFNQKWENKTMISLAGVYQPAKIIEQSKIPISIKKYLEKHPEIKKIYLCLDNDLAGRNASKALKTILTSRYEVLDRPPKFEKDYNDYLCKFLGINRAKKLSKERSR